MDTINGEVPTQIMEFVNGWYSIRSANVPGFRFGGLYCDECFARTEAKVEQWYANQPEGRSYFIVEVCGAGLENVMGLHQAILADELLPVSLGSKTATQLAEKLEVAKIALSQCEQKNEELNYANTALKDELGHSDRQCIDLAATLTRANGLCGELLQEIEQLRETTRPWYKKLGDWLSNNWRTEMKRIALLPKHLKW